MSLAIEDDRRGGRSRSTSRDRRSRGDPAQGPALTYADLRETSGAYPQDDHDNRYQSSRRQEPAWGGGLPYPAESGVDSLLPGRQALYSYDDPRPLYRAPSPARDSSYRSSSGKADDQLPSREDYRARQYGDKERRARYAEPSDSRRGTSYDDEPRARYPEPPTDKYGQGAIADDRLNSLPRKYSRRYEDDDDGRHSSRDQDRKGDRRSKKDRDQDDLAYGRPQSPLSSRPESPPTYASYFSGEKRSTESVRDGRDDGQRSGPLDHGHGSSKSFRNSYRDGRQNLEVNAPTVGSASRERERSRDRRRDQSPGATNLAVEPDRRERDKSRDRRGSARDRSPQPPTARMSSLSVGTGRSSNWSLAAAPASPLLESYHGTYQDCSPMPSPLLLASQSPGEAMEPLSPLSPNFEGDTRKISRRARFHDPEDIASRMARALKGTGSPDTQPLVEILPSLTHEQVMELRVEYKRLVKTGSERKGVNNVAKHIRARLKDEDPNLMKACYCIALGRWEIEAYWANFWYHGDKTRRELLIESLMGRTNYEVRQIKDAFTDKKYDNSLTRCMKTELKEDKFKKAVLMVLEERRMEDYDSHGRRVPLDYELVDRDVDDLRRAVKAEKGGESAMIAIVVKRSESHLRAVLKEYEHHYRANFAREALRKSGNLVGELLAHILNGIINRPVRDALLLQHALAATRKDELRRELLISRLVRFHWDTAHMQAVKMAFRQRYAKDLQDAVREATSGQWGRFCSELCIARMPDDVRRVERVEAMHGAWPTS